MYFLHPFVEINVRDMISNYFAFYFPGGFALFIMTTIVTYVLATLTYTYIERPFLHGKKQSVLRTQVV